MEKLTGSINSCFETINKTVDLMFNTQMFVLKSQQAISLMQIISTSKQIIADAEQPDVIKEMMKRQIKRCEQELKELNKEITRLG